MPSASILGRTTRYSVPHFPPDLASYVDECAPLLLNDTQWKKTAVVGQLVVVDPDHQAAGCRHSQWLPLRADPKRRAVAHLSDQRTDGHGRIGVVRAALRTAIRRGCLTRAAAVCDLAARLERHAVALVDGNARICPRLIGRDADGHCGSARSNRCVRRDDAVVHAARAGWIDVHPCKVIGRDILAATFA